MKVFTALCGPADAAETVRLYQPAPIGLEVLAATIDELHRKG